MILKKFLIASLSLFCLLQVAMADAITLTKQHSDCMEKSGGVTVSMLECNAAETKRQEIRHTKVYKEVMSQLSQVRKKQLLDAQRAWIKYREANCAFYADPDGGTIATINASSCFLSATVERVKELERFKE